MIRFSWVITNFAEQIAKRILSLEWRKFCVRMTQGADAGMMMRGRGEECVDLHGGGGCCGVILRCGWRN